MSESEDNPVVSKGHLPTLPNKNRIYYVGNGFPSGIMRSTSYPSRALAEADTLIRILLLADSHLGFDHPLQPRVQRRRRGPDFLANHEAALAPAMAGMVDLVIHGGDVFHRSRVDPALVYRGFRSLIEIAESGIPVFVVPGNHERSRIPHDRFAIHSNLHIFREPCTGVVDVRGHRVALSGFPYHRSHIRQHFPGVLQTTGWRKVEAEVRLICMHHCVEGATVGPSDYTFRTAPDVIKCSDIPPGFAAVVSGHIHRHQVLREDLKGRTLPAPVVYPGSVERTAFAEKDEEKGYSILGCRPNDNGGFLARHDFIPLPTRPMVLRELHPEAGPTGIWKSQNLSRRLSRAIESMPREAVARIKVHGRIPPEARLPITAARLRELAPSEMNLEVLLAEDGDRGERPRRRGPRTFHTDGLAPDQPTLALSS